MLPDDLDGLPSLRMDGFDDSEDNHRTRPNPAEWDDPTFDEVCGRLDVEFAHKRLSMAAARRALGG